MQKEKPNKTVAIVSTISCGCQYVADVKTIKRSEYATLLKEQRQHEQERTRYDRELLNRVKELEETCERLQQEIRVLKGEDDYEESIED